MFHFLKVIIYIKSDIEYIKKFRTEIQRKDFREICKTKDFLNGILFDYFVRKTMTQTIPLLKSSFPLLLKLEISLERPFIPERSEGIKES